MSIRTNNNLLMTGDTVEVLAGDLVGMQGKIVTLQQGSITVQPTNIGLAEVEILSNQVRKYIPLYARVKVVDGRHIHQTGTVVAKGPTRVVVITDEGNQEITVRPWHVQETTEIATGLKFLDGYQLYDLVQLMDLQVGMIVRVGLTDVTVLTQANVRCTVSPQEIHKKLCSRRLFSFDTRGKQLQVGDSIRVVQGPSRGITTATIKGMSKSQLFLYSPTQAKDAGITLAYSRHCELAGQSFPTRKKVVPQCPPTTFRGRGYQRDGLLGKTVCIRSGTHKGLHGVVTEATATNAWVSLLAKSVKVQVRRERLVVIQK